MSCPVRAVGLTIRPARLDDADELGEVHVRAWRWAYRGQLSQRFLSGLDPEALAAGWLRLLGPDGNGFRAWVADVGGVIVGFAGSGPARDEDLPRATIELYRLYLLEEFVWQGIGAALMREAEAQWRLDRYANAAVWVLASNELGRTFYARAGWRPDGTERELYLAGEGYLGLRLTKELLPGASTEA